ncbi:MAG: hypothetical protein ACRDJ1_06570 [Actinomycetota bacterium]
MIEFKLQTTVGPLEVWLSAEGELEVYALDGSDRAVRMVGQIVEIEGDLAAILEELGLIDREAAFYAHEIWIRVAPTGPTTLRTKLLRWRGREEFPTAIPFWTA